MPRTQAKRGVGIVEPCGSRLTPSPCSIILPISLRLNPQEDDAIFFEFSKNAEDGHLGAMSSMCQAAGKNRG